jgi:enoyl-CoA hydratase
MIRLDHQGRLATLTLDRPDKANALTRAMLEDLGAHLVALDGQADALILTGTGAVFSAGADLDEARAGLATDPVWDRVTGALARFPGLTIAALNGTLAGGAFGLALACQIRLAVPAARFFYPVMKLGFLPQPADPGRLVALVGPGRAALILAAGHRALADEALAWGLVDRLVDPADLIPAARALAADALAAPPGHAGRIAAMIPRHLPHPG